MKTFQYYLWATSLLFQDVFSLPTSTNPTSILGESHGVSRRGTKKLRIMPLGASITFGVGNDPQNGKNGYRKYVRDWLIAEGYEVDMVGSQMGNGQMPDNQNEGHPGALVKDITRYFDENKGLKPNLVLINGGTNDCTNNQQAGQPERMKKLVDLVFESIPGVTVVLSGLLPNKKTSADECAKLMDEKYLEQMKLYPEGKKWLYRRWHTGWISVDELPDGTHPNDEGFKKIAAMWTDAIQEAEKKGWLTDPIEAGSKGNDKEGVCDKAYGTGIGPVQTQQGTGTDDGNYRHSSTPKGELLRFAQDKKEDQNGKVWFADLNGDGRDEFIWYKDPAKGLFEYWYDTAPDSSTPFKKKEVREFQITPACGSDGSVTFADVNGDRCADLICIGSSGDIHFTINSKGAGNSQGSGSAFDSPNWKSVGKVHDGSGSKDAVRIADIDGDGRADYCTVAGNGDISCKRNGGQGDIPEYWQDLGVVFKGKGKGDIKGVHFVDINGDGRDDWLYVNDDGSVDTYINNRGYEKGSINPDWRDASQTHSGMQTAGAGKSIYFGRVGNCARKDYMYLRTSDGKDGKYTYFDWFKNEGSGGTQLKGDGVFYCDMNGDGAADYAWISPKGEVHLYQNDMKPPSWTDKGVIHKADDWPRKKIRLADIDGDGKCDLVFISPNNDAVHWRKNTFDGKAYGFGDRQQLAGLSCPNQDGVGLFDVAIEFADINGDKKADMLCMDRDGRTSARVSQATGGSYKDMGQVKKSEGADRANLRWADVNGDGKADMLWVDKFNGDAKVWYNEGEKPSAGSSMTWRPAGKAFQGSARGDTLHFFDLRGTGRADMYEVHPRDNTAKVWYNPECGGGGKSGEGEKVVKPELPEVPSNVRP